MAATDEAIRLTEAHRLAQAQLGAQSVRQALAAWVLLDPERLDATMPDWLRIMVPLIQAARRTSAVLAANYLTAFRTFELGMDATPFVPIIAPAADVAAVTTSLVVTGPVRIKSAMTGGVDLARAVQHAETSMAKAAMRHILDGGRGTITTSIAADRRALGWARATSGSPCAFCALVASRGPVYKSRGTADFEPHDGCACTPEPVYRRDAAWPAGSRRFAAIYANAQDADGDTTANFRRLIEAA